MSKKVCVTIGAHSIEEINEKLTKIDSELVELRLDFLPNLPNIVEDVIKLVNRFSSKHEFILTVRNNREGGHFKGDESTRLHIISKIMEAQPSYVDIELYSSIAKDVIKVAEENDVKVIASYHNFEETPDLKKLRLIVQKGIMLNSSLIKIITMAKSYLDNITILQLVSSKPGKIIGFCMGKLGIPSRVLAPFFGAPFTFASFNEEVTAPGQIDVKTVREIWRLMELEK
jgi:3-dehydroquinate dehydratase-1